MCIRDSSYIASKIEQSLQTQAPYLKQDEEVLCALEAEAPQEAGLFRYIHDSGNYPVYRNTQLKYFPLGEDCLLYTSDYDPSAAGRSQRSG